ncbi:homogentisate phytyltransferase [Geitlerinema sp. CS-897]|nr:homogentisate phytyltransferase [Geitlerinema sp. CS-897]
MDSTPIAQWQKTRSLLYAFWKFSRPHTIVGTTLSVWGLFALAVGVGEFTTASLLPPLVAWLACLCGNVYIVGLNQLEDIEIDRVNKPHLPLASGEFSPLQGRWIVGVTGIAAIAIAATQGIWLFATVAVSLALGTAYSLPPLRLKRFPFWASFCIFTVRGVVVNLGLFLHFNDGFPVSPEVWALTLFVLGFTFAIAIFKDIPDFEGDKRYNISTLTIRLGASAVSRLALVVISLCDVAMAVGGLLWLPNANGTLVVTMHLAVLVLLWWRRRDLDLEDRGAIAQFYQFIWKLFFLEYIMFPIACLWQS